MKRILISMLAVFACLSLSAQLKVNSNGNVSIQSDETPQSAFTINSVGIPRLKVYIDSQNSGVYINRSVRPTLFGWGVGLESAVAGSSSIFNGGVIGRVDGDDSTNSGRGFGVYGAAGGTTSGYNWGVCGVLNGTQNGAGIYGSIVDWDTGSYVSGRYAGYFRGDVYVTGNIYGQILTRSAVASQENVRSLSAEASENGDNVLDKLMRVSTIQYNMKEPNTAIPALARMGGDTLTVAPTPTEEELQSLQKNHYGFIAQDLQQVYPDLVYENSKGELSINSMEMIPLLVESIQELTTEINELKANPPAQSRAQTTGIENVGDNQQDQILLFQNNPNPFTENTEIKCSLPQRVKDAAIYIYDMNGKQIDEIPLEQRGSCAIILQGKKLSAGMYMYSLIADGKVIDVKRMILT